MINEALEVNPWELHFNYSMEKNISNIRSNLRKYIAFKNLRYIPKKM